MLKQENRIHVIAVEKALGTVYGGDDEEQITDILSDLRHLCDARGLDYYRLDRKAYRLYADEGGAQ